MSGIYGDKDLQAAPNIDEASEMRDMILEDMDFAFKNANDLPPGWVEVWTSDGDPFWVETATNLSTWTHPRQKDASLLYGNDFDLSKAWKTHCLQRMASDPDRRQAIPPTYGELVLEFSAHQGPFGSGDVAPWWIAHHNNDENQDLCAVCRHINFDILLHTIDPHMYEPPIKLGALFNIAKKNCSFCRLVTHTAGTVLDDAAQAIEAVQAVIRCTLVGDPQWNRSETRYRLLCVKFSLALPNGNEIILKHGWIQEILQTSRTIPEQKNNDCRFVKDQIDFNLVKSWLRICEQQHVSVQLQSTLGSEALRIDDIHRQDVSIKESCQPIPLFQSSLGLTVIDVERECLIDTDLNTRYIALSYVWGGPQPFQNIKNLANELYTSGTISSKNARIPKTIRDSIKLVAMLGEKYLWVDSLCIVQDSTEEKMAQIANMGNIYSRAVLTIVASFGNSCNAGLPGVQADSRKTLQHTELVQNLRLANQLPYMEDIIDGSVWNTRGWTYQEKELSTRCLFFSENCVYFSCNQKIFKEDSGAHNVGLRGDREARIRVARHPIWNSYRRAVTNFTKRVLTFEGDIVHAFEGMISLLQPGFKCDFLCGLPETELDIALLWQPKSLISRRVHPETGEPMFPSWSWAGWVGEIRYVWTKHMLDDLSRVKWQDYNSGEYVTSDELRLPRSGNTDGWKFVPNQSGTPYYFEPQNPDIWCLHPTAERSQRIPRTLVLPGSHELKFKALSANFHIAAKAHSLHFDPMSSCTTEKHILCPVEILSAHGAIAGTIYVPAHIMGSLKSGIQELICLSRRRGKPYDAFNHGEATSYEDFPGSDKEDPTVYPQLEDDLKEALPDPSTIYPEQYPISQVYDKYDHQRYDPFKPWPLYNVMMIERYKQDGPAYRVALGIIHVTAFMAANPTEKLIVLA